MKVAVSDSAKALMAEIFKVDETGKPQAEFEILTGPAPGNDILKQHHGLKAFPALKAIDDYIDDIVANLGENGKDVGQMMNDWQVLSAHASKVMGQAIYLDTSDRNSWTSIRQTMVHEPGNEKFQSRYSKEIRDFWHGNMDRHLELSASQQDLSPGL